MIETQQVQRTAIGQASFLGVAVEAFMFDRRAAGVRGSTLKFYQHKLQTFIDFLDQRELRYLEQLQPTDIREFLVSLEGTHTPGGIHAFYRCIRALLRWCEDEEILPAGTWQNPIKRVKAPRVDIEPLQPIPLEDVRKVLDTCNTKQFTDLRDAAIFLCLLDSAVRASELLALNTDDVDLLSGSVLIRKSKSRKPRTTYIGKNARKALRAYLRARTDTDAALFVNRTGERLEYDSLRQVLARRCKRAGIKVWLPHSWRRAAALSMLRAGVDVYTLQHIMGHSDLQVLQRYLKVDNNDAATAHARCSPGDRL